MELAVRKLYDVAVCGNAERDGPTRCVEARFSSRPDALRELDITSCVWFDGSIESSSSSHFGRQAGPANSAEYSSDMHATTIRIPLRVAGRRPESPGARATPLLARPRQLTDWMDG